MIQQKIKTRKELIDLCRALKKQGNSVGFTSGVFDLLHAGHVDYLEKAKGLCNVLIVGVNTDSSVKRYKGKGRPLVNEEHRIKVLAALESVDYVFLFEERRNQKNIEVLKPDFYIKAGDYRPEQLTSKSEVEKYGGKVRIISIDEDISTTAILNKMSESSSLLNRFVEEKEAFHIERKKSKKSPAVFLDRDGTINKEISYLHDPEDFEILPNALKGIKKVQDMGYKIIIVSNQPGIGMGYYTKEDFYRVNREMLSLFSKAAILVDKIYFCPHSKSEKCDCRKPGQSLIKRAKEDLNLDLPNSFFIGDKSSDMETGKRAGMKTILVKSGFKGEDGEFTGEPDYWAEDLLEASDLILRLERS
jgi:rfaE bifunctional protein nucleotidyltransferase chain/domain